MNSTHLATVTLKEDAAPKWIQIFPAGPDLETTDGRTFKLTKPEALASQLNKAGPILIDYDHRSHYAADDGGSTEAAGWLNKFEVRDGALWGEVEWTEKAATSISQKLYRHISPEFLVHKKTKEVTDVVAAALLNRPAFDMTALASKKKHKEENMFEEIAKELGLEKDADKDAVLAAIVKLQINHETELASANAKVVKAKTPSTDDFMPTADYKAVLARAEKAEKAVSEAGTKEFDAKVETMIATAIKAGKITPASKEHFTALCADEKSFETTRKALEISPEVIGKTEIKDKPGDKQSVLTAEQKTMAASLGVSEEDYSKELASEAAA